MGYPELKSFGWLLLCLSGLSSFDLFDFYITSQFLILCVSPPPSVDEMYQQQQQQHKKRENKKVKEEEEERKQLDCKGLYYVGAMTFSLNPSDALKNQTAPPRPCPFKKKKWKFKTFVGYLGEDERACNNIQQTQNKLISVLSLLCCAFGIRRLMRKKKKKRPKPFLYAVLGCVAQYICEIISTILLWWFTNSFGQNAYNYRRQIINIAATLQRLIALCFLEPFAICCIIISFSIYMVTIWQKANTVARSRLYPPVSTIIQPPCLYCCCIRRVYNNPFNVDFCFNIANQFFWNVFIQTDFCIMHTKHRGPSVSK